MMLPLMLHYITCPVFLDVLPFYYSQNYAGILASSLINKQLSKPVVHMVKRPCRAKHLICTTDKAQKQTIRNAALGNFNSNDIADDVMTLSSYCSSVTLHSSVLHCQQFT